MSSTQVRGLWRASRLHPTCRRRGASESGLCAREGEGADVIGGDEASMTDLVEAPGQGVAQEASEEVHRVERAGLPVLGGEGHRLAVVADEAGVRDADAMRVAPEVTEDLLRPANGAFA